MFLTHILPLIFLLIGLGLLAGCAYLIRKTRLFLERAMETPGRVVEMRAVSDSDGTTHMPVVEFTAPSGDRAQFESGFSSSPPSYRVGDAVTVLYDPQNFKDARIRSFLSLWIAPLLFGVLGGVFTGLGAAMLTGLIPLHR